MIFNKHIYIAEPFSRELLKSLAHEDLKDLKICDGVPMGVSTPFGKSD